MFNVLKQFTQRTNYHAYTSFILILSQARVLTCSILYYYFWLLVNKSKSWFLYGKIIFISYAVIYGQLHRHVILPMDEFNKLFIVHWRYFS